MDSRYQFNRMELAGSLGDLGTLLPIVVGMILINRLSPTTVFLAFGLFYLMTGFYYRLPIPVQPLKAVGAIALAYPNQITESVIGAGGILFGSLLLVLSLSGMVDRLARLFTQPVVRGIQLALGLIFLKKGIELIVTQNLFLSGVDRNLSNTQSIWSWASLYSRLSWLCSTTRSSQQPWQHWPLASLPAWLSAVSRVNHSRSGQPE